MSYPASARAIAGAQAYEDLHVPCLFREWVGPVLDAARVAPGERVLDVACGTGVLARGARERVGPAGAVVGVDPDAGMLAVAARIAPSVDWRLGSAEALPAPDAAFDAVVSQFGMMFFEDRARAAREMARVLGEGGRVVIAVWDVLENQPAFAVETALLESLAGHAAADALRAPFSLGDPDVIRGVLEAAGLRDVRVDSRAGTARFPSVRALVAADLRGWLPVMGVHLPDEVVEAVLGAADREMAGFVSEDGVVFECTAHILSGTKG